MVIGDSLLKTASKINYRDIGCRYTHRHAGKLAIQGWNDLSDGLGSTSAARNDVLSSGASSSPIFGGWTIDGFLSSSVGMNGGHETLNDGEVVVDDLGKRGEAVGRARSVRDDLNIRLVGFLIHAHDEHGGIGGRCGYNDFLRSSFQVGLGFLGCGENAGRLDDIVCSSLGPGDVGRVFLSVEFDFLAIDNEVAALDFNRALKATMLRVVFEHVCLEVARQALETNGMLHGDEGAEVCGQDGSYRVVWLNERIIDCDDLHVTMLNAIYSINIVSLADFLRSPYVS